ncbi:hypothetical protein C6497_03845 [Candidatus Poribacteria bacterium]|nr:MAG: hypothetical protein C6497_03845 [Candidatus Poribacteria bacterium]
MNNEQHQARIDGEQDADTDVSRILWIVIGFFVTIIGVIIAFVYQPSPPASRMVEKSQEYIMFYTEAYKNKAKNIQVTNALIGVGIGFGVGIMFFIFALGIIGSMSRMGY